MDYYKSNEGGEGGGKKSYKNRYQKIIASTKLPHSH